MQSIKYTNKDGFITIAQGTEHIAEGTFCEADFKEMYVPASVKTLEYPLDLCEELEADLYLYGVDTEIKFSEQALWRVVSARINTIALILTIAPPFVARFYDAASDVCLKLWGIALINWCLYYVWRNYDLVVVVNRRADGSVEYSNEHMRDIKKNPYWKYT